MKHNKTNYLVFIGLLIIVTGLQSCKNDNNSINTIQVIADTLKSIETKNPVDSDGKTFISRTGKLSIIDTTKIKFYSYFLIEQTTKLDTCKNLNDYVGLVKTEDNRYYLTNFQALKQIYIEATGAGFWQFYTNLTVKPQYIFESFKVDTTHWIKGRGYEKSIFAIGDFTEYNLNRSHYCFYTTGEIEQQVKDNINPIQSLKDYKLHFRSIINNSLSDTVIYSNENVFPDLGEYIHGIGISWIGDLNSDGKIDFITYRRNHYTHFGNSLYFTFGDSNLVVKKLADFDVSAD